MAAFNQLELLQQAAAVSRECTEIVGEKLPRRYRRKIDPEKYALLRECVPYGDKPVPQVARERGMNSKQLWRWLHRTRLELETLLVREMPFRVLLLLEHGRELYEQSSRFDQAEDYLKRAGKLIRELALPEQAAVWLRGQAALELGHVYRDRGRENHRNRAVAQYKTARDEFLGMTKDWSDPWRDETISAAWIEAERALLEMQKTFALDHPKAASTYYQRAITGYSRLAELLKPVQSRSALLRRESVEVERLLGEYLSLVGEGTDGLALANRSCESPVGNDDDRVNRLLRRGEILIRLGRYDAAVDDLQSASHHASELPRSKGLRSVLISKAYCRLYQQTGDDEALIETAESALRSCNRLGVLGQAQKIRGIVEDAI